MSSAVGVGIDVVALGRFANTISRTPGLLARLFTPAERTLPPRSLAGRFAAKEALAKALGAPGGLSWQDAEVIREPSGQPRFVLRGTVEAAATARGVSRVHLSISHDGDIATAIVLLTGGAP
ncbi:MAG: holo-ACP synthase [Angustibacter sp.]